MGTKEGGKKFVLFLPLSSLSVRVRQPPSHRAPTNKKTAWSESIVGDSFRVAHPRARAQRRRVDFRMLILSCVSSRLSGYLEQEDEIRATKDIYQAFCNCTETT